ncbi:MAG: alpha/beta hydrolase [Deltaproteobacteria bacterium]|nr:alpha/beta hydrolase [Deltaproteobacteria bacterium]
MDELEPIQVRRCGSHGPPVVVLHGGPGAPGSAAGLARAIADDFQILEPLQRRSGRVPLTVSRHVDDLSAVAPRPVMLIGTSWGAMLGLSFAARYPRDVSALVLVGCGTYDENSRVLFRASLDQRLGAPGRERIATLKNRLASELNAANRNVIQAELGAAYMKAESYDLIEEDGDVADGAWVDEAGHVETWNDALRLQREGVEPDAFSRISARVLMIHGDVDPHPGPATRDLLRRFIPQLEYVELERCGHEPWRERHARHHFVELVREWCNRQTAQPNP